MGCALGPRLTSWRTSLKEGDDKGGGRTPPWPQVTGSGEVEERRRQLEAGQPWVEGDAQIGLE
jgi:hypothetical protein